MRYRYLSVAATIATSALIACGDAAVDQVTAPPSAATPAQPVANEWPTEDEYIENAIPAALGIQVSVSPSFEQDNKWYVVEGRVRFQWVNVASATIQASLIDQKGTVINSSSASMGYSRLALPVPSGDTTFVVRISTNGITCGLTGKSTYEAHAAQRALDIRLVEITLWEQTIGKTSGPDLLQPACPPKEDECQALSRVIGGTPVALLSTSINCDGDAPAPPNGGSEPVEVCYTVWREVWIWDITRGTWQFLFEFPVGVFCYVPET